MTLAPHDPVDRAWWHLHLSPEILYADHYEPMPPVRLWRSAK